MTHENNWSIHRDQKKEHQLHIHLGHPVKWAVAEHRLNRDHYIKFLDTHILSTKSCYMDRFIGGIESTVTIFCIFCIFFT
jgi:hypothetical protein